MIFVVAILFALVGMVVGGLAGALIYLLIGELLGASDFEGALAMGSVYGGAPIGAVLGGLAGIVLAVRMGRRAHPKTLRRTAGGIVLSIAALVVAIGVSLWEDDGNPYDLDKPRPVIHFEIRLPAGGRAPVSNRVLRGTLNSYITFTILHWTKPLAVRLEGEHAIISGTALVFYRVDNREIEFWFHGDEEHRIFDLRLPDDLTATDSFTEWRRVDQLADAEGESRKPAPETEDYFIRTRIEIRPPEQADAAAAD